MSGLGIWLFGALGMGGGGLESEEVIWMFYMRSRYPIYMSRCLMIRIPADEHLRWVLAIWVSENLEVWGLENEPERPLSPRAGDCLVR